MKEKGKNLPGFPVKTEKEAPDACKHNNNSSKSLKNKPRLKGYVEWEFIVAVFCLFGLPIIGFVIIMVSLFGCVCNG